ncbi:MAG: DNA/RNA non-specific endonuclease [Microscillaceae bacterium]|nr:DNA/RNA non-specific endonuclease [Microscillaceae bacterium]
MRILLVLWICLPYLLNAQGSLEQQIQLAEQKLEVLKAEEEKLNAELESLKLLKIHEDMQNLGLPKCSMPGELIRHAAITLRYSEDHEQAIWVAHMILPDVKTGNISRSNDFRPDPLVKSGSAVEADYFLRTLQKDSSYLYDGFGYDRGHLAPSADFRWSQKALSESYYYSNMSPQVPELNRGRWSELEDALREYAIRKNQAVFVVTGGILEENLPRISRSVNQVSIPKLFYKVVLDPANRRAIGFVMPNQNCTYPLTSYACSVDSIEQLTGIDFFGNYPEQVEASFQVYEWLGPREQQDVDPLPVAGLPRNHFNTVQAKIYADSGEVIKVCGKVVSTKLSGKGNIFLNLDKSFPNQIFTVSIFKDKTANFSYAPEEYLKGKTICIKGKVSDYNGVPSMIIENEKDIEIWESE